MILKKLTSVLLLASVVIISCNNNTTESNKEKTVMEEVDVSDLQSYKAKPLGPIDKDIAEKWVNKYRKAWSFKKKTDVVWHEPSEVKNYIDSVFLKYTALIAPPAGYEWKLAMSPMFFNEDGDSRLAFCLLPCLVNSATGKKGYDFFEEKGKNSSIYTDYFLKLYNSVRDVSYSGKSFTDPGFIFDEGQLWP